jgi:hypothetical protein
MKKTLGWLGAAILAAAMPLGSLALAQEEGMEEERPIPKLRGSGEWSFTARMSLRYALRPWRIRTAQMLLRRKKELLPALSSPLFLNGRKLEDRTVVFSRLIWKYWGDRQVVVPDLAVRKSDLTRAALRGIQICRRFFPFFTLYIIHVRKFGNRPRYEMSSIPASSDDHVAGIEFSPLLEGANFSRDHFQSFKNAIYDLGLEIGGSYYRFGGLMKPYIRKIFGDAVVDRQLAIKRKLDPSFILNPNVIF